MSEMPMTDGVVLHYDRRGVGRPIVLIHGLAAGSGFFGAAADDLAADHHVVSVDLHGHGASSPGTAPVTVEAIARDLRRLLTELDLHDVVLVGWSLGATVMFAVAESAGPGRVSKLISVEQTPYLLAEQGWAHSAFGGLDAAGARAVVEQIETDPAGFARHLVSSSFAAGSEPDADLLDELVAQAAACSPVAVAQLFGDAIGQDWRRRVRSIGQPVLLIHGARSQVYPTAVGEWLADAIPGARLEMFADSGHLPFVEEQDRFTALVREFVAS